MEALAIRTENRYNEKQYGNTNWKGSKKNGRNKLWDLTTIDCSAEFMFPERIPSVTGILTTFDVRMKEPNREMVMDTSVMHTIEHS